MNDNCNVENKEVVDLLFFEEETDRLIMELIRNRKRCKMTQEELAKASGVSRITIARIESFSIQPELITILKLLRVFNKTIALVDLEK